MKIKAFIILVFFGILFPMISNAQLSDSAIKELSQNHVDKWSVYLHFSNLREEKFKHIVEKHEYKKSEILMSSVQVKDLLINENQRFIKEIGKILTSSELKIYKTYIENENIENKKYFRSLMTAINLDEKFIDAFNQLQYSEVFPSLLTFRSELEDEISRQDRITLEAIRNEVFEVYDNCLLFCLADEARDSTLFDNLNDLFLVDVNKGLSEPSSVLSKLIILTHKYEDQIHEIQIKHSKQYDYWQKKTREFEKEYLLPNYVENLKKLQNNSPFASLVHLESEALFLLIDPSNKTKSRKILSLGYHHLY